MNRYLFLILSFSYSISASAQTIYYDEACGQTRKKNATQYAIFTKTDSGYDANIYTMAEVRIISGHYNTLPNNLNEGRNGRFTYYFMTGNVSSVRMYLNNLRTGLWKEYVYSTGGLKTEVHYDHD